MADLELACPLCSAPVKITGAEAETCDFCLERIVVPLSVQAKLVDRGSLKRRVRDKEKWAATIETNKPPSLIRQLGCMAIALAWPALILAAAAAQSAHEVWIGKITAGTGIAIIGIPVGILAGLLLPAVVGLWIRHRTERGLDGALPFALIDEERVVCASCKGQLAQLSGVSAKCADCRMVMLLPAELTTKQDRALHQRLVRAKRSGNEALERMCLGFERANVVGGALYFLEGCALLIGIPLCMVVFLQDYSASARFGLGLGVAIMPTGVLFTVAYCSIQQRDIRWAVFGKR